MKRSRGFTIVELLLTITIMVILMTLAIVNVRSTQANARDEERKNDVENIARGLEQRYNQGNSRIAGNTKGSYPNIFETSYADGSSDCLAQFTPCEAEDGYLYTWLPGTSKESYFAPGSDDIYEGFISFNGATSSPSEVESSILPAVYMYVPYTRDGGWCNSSTELDQCVRFDLYYKTEVDNQIHIIKSKHQ